MPTFDFDAARKERMREREPITFVLAGETFTCVPFVPLAVAWGLADAPERAELDGERPSNVFRRLAEMIADMLIPDDVDRWWSLFSRKDEMVDVDTLLEVTASLVEVYGGRPTSPSTDSSAGRQNGTQRSNSKPSRKASARSAN